MADTTNTGGAGNPAQSPNVIVYAACVIAGLAVGVLGTLAMNGGLGGGGSDPVVAEFNGKSVKGSEAFAPIKTRLFDLEDEVYRTKEQAVRDYVEQRLLEAEAKKNNMPVEALLDKEAGQVSDNVTDADIESFLSSKGLSLKDPRIRKDDVRDYLKYRKKFEKRQAYVARLEQSSNVKILLKEPASPKLNVATEGYPTWGNPKAPVTVVEFSDFQCPFCARAIPTLDRLKQEYGQDKIKIVFRPMPLPAHPRAMPSALASLCANEQGKFWEFHNMLFENQQKLEDADLKGYAKKLSLDEAKFASCYDSKKYEKDLEKSRQEAEQVGIQATPTFVINGVLLQGAQPFEKFKEKIDHAAKSR